MFMIRAVPILSVSVSAVSAILESIGIGKIIPKFADTADTLKKMSDLMVRIVEKPCSLIMI